MPTINVNKKEFLKLICKKLTDQEIEEKISMMGVSIEDVNENEIIVEVFANRPDLLSEYGLARAASTFLGTSKGLKNYKANKSNYIVKVENPVNEYQYAVAAVVKGLKLNDEKIKEIIQIQEKLGTTFLRNRKKGSMGIYPLDKIKFPIRFTSELPDKIKFRPLEFPGELNGFEILEQHPKGKDYKHIVNGWKKFPIFVDANKKIMSMPPIINSHELGKITEETRDVFIELTGTDFRSISIALNILVIALAEMGGRVYATKMISGNKTYYTPNLENEKVKVDVNYINKRIGLNLNKNEIKGLLEKMGYGVKGSKILTALVPAYRADIIHQIDLAEDVAIAYGYDKLIPEIPQVATIGEENELEIFKRKVASILVGLKLIEVHTYNLINKENQTTKMNTSLKCVELANSLSEEYSTLRGWMLPSLIQVLKENKHNEYPQNIFGFGQVFRSDSNKDTGVSESLNLCVFLCNSGIGFTEVKQVLEILTKALGLKYQLVEEVHGSFISGRIGKIVIDSMNVGYIGEVHPQVLENFSLELPVAAIEIDLNELFKLIKK